MDVDDLVLFLRVLDTGSFARAARTANLDPSVVSRRIAALEARLGTRLLHRTTRAVSATDAGRDWAERVRPAVQLLHDAEDDLRAGHGEVAGTVRLAVPGALGRRRVAPLVFQLVALHPSLRIDLLVSDNRVELVEQAVDIAVRVGFPRDTTVLVKRLGVSPQVLVAAPSFLAARPGPITLTGLPVVMRIEGGTVIDAVPTGLRPEWVVRLACDDVETVARAAEAGLGAAMLPEWLAQDALDRGTLVRLPDLFPVPVVPIVALLPAGRQSPRRVRVVLDALTSGLSTP